MKLSPPCPAPSPATNIITCRCILTKKNKVVSTGWNVVTQETARCCIAIFSDAILFLHRSIKAARVDGPRDQRRGESEKGGNENDLPAENENESGENEPEPDRDGPVRNRFF